MQIDVDFTSWLQWQTFNQYPVEQNKIAEDYTTSPAIMFIRRDSNTDVYLGGSQGLNTTLFDVEVYGIDVDAVDAVVESIRPALNGFRGMMGFTTVLGAFVENHNDGYTPKIDLETDDGLHVQTFALKIIHL